MQFVYNQRAHLLLACIIFIRIQAGQYAEAIELMEERLNDELSDLGERPDEMADVYQNMARCKSEVNGLYDIDISYFAKTRNLFCDGRDLKYP